MWRYQVPELRAAGWRTLALDPPGQGRSKGVDRAYTMDECADAAVAVLDGLDVRTPVLVLGTSWGGMIAPRIALRAPNRVRGIVAFNTTADSATPLEWCNNTLLTKMLAIGALDEIVDTMIVSLVLAPETRRQHPGLGQDITRTYRSWNRRGLINTVRAVLCDRNSFLDALPYVTTLTLVVSGKEGPILPSPHSRRIVEKMPNARHLEVPRAAHLVPLEQPEAANALIRDFIADLQSDKAYERKPFQIV